MPFPRRLKIIIGVFLVVAATFLVYYPSLNNHFVSWDDQGHITENLSIRGLDIDHLKEMFTSKINGTYIPLTSLSFAIEYHFINLNPYFYHLTNLLLHVMNALLVYTIVHRLGVGFVGSAVAGLIFGLHPMHVESVSWVTERKDVLYAFFYLLAMLAYLKYQFALKRGKSGWLFLVWVYGLGILSMLSKPMALTLPFILLLLDWYEGRKFSIKSVLEKVPLLMIVTALAICTFVSYPAAVNNSIFEKALLFSYSFVFYIQKFIFWDFSVAIYHLPKPLNFSNSIYVLSFLAFIGVGGAAWFLRKNKDFIFALGFYVLSIFVILRTSDLTFTHGPHMVSDRFMYLPCLGFCLLLAKWVESCWLSKNPRWLILQKLAVVAMVSVLFYIGMQTFNQTKMWKDGFALWQTQLKHYPNDSIALNNLATNYRDLPDYKKAEREYRNYKIVTGGVVAEGVLDKTIVEKISLVVGLLKASIESNSENKESIYNLGNLYYDLGEFEVSLKCFQDALKLDPKYQPAVLGMGDVYLALKQSKQAVEFFNQSKQVFKNDEDLYLNIALSYKDFLKKNKDVEVESALAEILNLLEGLEAKKGRSATSLFNLGFIYGEIGNLAKAQYYYEKTIQKNSHYANALYNLGNLYKDGGRLLDALKMYESVVRVEPARAEAYLNIGVIYNRLSKFSEATNYFKKALEVDPEDGRPYFNLAYISEVAGNLKDAVRNYQLSIEKNPDNSEAYYNLGNVYAKTGQNKEAVAVYSKAVEVNPKHLNAWVNLSIISYQDKDYQNAVKYCDEAVLLGYVPEEGYLEALKVYRGK